jgi:hypothetical protein
LLPRAGVQEKERKEDGQRRKGRETPMQARTHDALPLNLAEARAVLSVTCQLVLTPATASPNVISVPPKTFE